MLKYFQNNYFILLYLLAFIMSLIKYRLYYDTILKYLPMVIAYTLLSEVLGLIVRDVENIQIIYEKEFYNYNTIIFNIFDIIFFLYFFYVYYHIIDNSRSKKIITYGSILFIISCILNLFTQDFYIEPQNYAIIIGSLILLYAVLMYLYNTFIEKHSLPLRNNLLFWISTGLLIFYIWYPISMYILTFNYSLYTEYNLSVYHYATIGLFYSCIIIGFTLMKRLRTATS